MTEALLMMLEDHDLVRIPGVQAFLEIVPSGGARLHLVRGKDTLVADFRTSRVLETRSGRPTITLLPHKDGAVFQMKYEGERIQAAVESTDWNRLVKTS
ncbi:MAG: hypothetical protein A3K07_04250 [Candidatus Doudnabacteria bacterium RIFCSPHIGHO2_01_43_10]|nr:MAG: hypothetical protein A3K07_04250 [Candidatus Doudnabacteria bacterium RIFCSPHIGHO2_01_43_10]